MIINELLRKWFGLESVPCATCEVLREQLHKSDRERGELLARLLEGNKTEPPAPTRDEPVPITPQFVPWRVRQQMLEQEDRKKAQLMRDKAVEIEELEKELGVSNDA